MSSFTEPLWLMPAGRSWVTTRAFRFWVGEEGSGLAVDVPAGTYTDLGSIPRALWWLLPRDDPRWAPAFVGHDDLCGRRAFPRFTAAAIFLEMLVVLARAHKLPPREWWRIWAMVAGVTVWALLHPYPITLSGSADRTD